MSMPSSSASAAVGDPSQPKARKLRASTVTRDIRKGKILTKKAPKLPTIPEKGKLDIREPRRAKASDRLMLPNCITKPVRRPKSWTPPPLPPEFFAPPVVPNELPTPDDPRLACFTVIFSEKVVTESEVFCILDDFLCHVAQEVPDIKKMVLYLMNASLECAVNVVPLFKALYVITQNPTVGGIIRDYVFEEAELKCGSELLEISTGPESDRRYRNFVRMIMALTHHYRNLQKAPIYDLVYTLYQISDALCHFQFFEDIPLFVILTMRVQLYAKLPPAIRADCDPKLVKERSQLFSDVLKKARSAARRKVIHGASLPPTYRKWLLLLLEARHWPTIDEDVRQHYADLSGFEKLLPKELNIKLPQFFSPADFKISHISEYVTISVGDDAAQEMERLSLESHA